MQTRTIAPAVDDSRLNIINALTKLATITTADPLDALRCIGILLAETCDVPTVYISQVNEIRIDHLIAFTKGNIATDTGQSRLEITPCATVALTKEITQYERVAEQFPEASYLQAVRASSYCGIPCLDQHGHVVGVACVLDERPRKYDTEDFDLFRIIGQRIGLEIVRRNDAEGLCLSRLHRLNRMAEMSLPKSGDSYEVFKNMVRIIGELFAVKVVCLSEIVGEELCFKSVYVNGETFRDAGRCPLATTPCATVESTKDLRVFDRVTEQFPQASFLRNHQAFTYCGFPILDSGGHVVAVVCLLDDKPHEFTDEDKELLKIFGQRTAVEIEHARQVEALKRTEEDLLASEELLRRVINSMSAHVAVLDKEGTIFAVNEAWDRFAHTNHANASSGVGIGVNYLDVCRLAASDDVLTRNVLHGIEEVQKGLRSSFEIEYPCHSPREERWFALRATPLSGSTGGIVVTHENITEWKRAEEALLLERDRLRQILDSLFGFVAVLSPEGLIEEANLAPLKMMGLQRATALGRVFWDIGWVEPGEEPLIQAAVQAAARGGTVRGDIVARFPAVGRRDVDAVFSPLRDATGLVIGVVAFGVDITERKQAEEALRASEERLRLALLASNQGFYDLDVRTGVAQVNAEYATMLGYDPATFEETNGRWAERLHPLDRDRVCGMYEAYIRGETPTYEVEFRQRTNSGAWKWILSIGSIVARDTDGRPLRMIGTHLDITDRKRAEEALRYSEERFRAAFQNATIGMGLVNASGTIIEANTALSNITGYTEQELKGLQFVDITHPNDRTLNLTLYHDALEGKRDSYVLEKRYIRKDGGIAWVKVSAGTIHDAQGHVTHTVGLIEDISERKQAEEALRASEERLRLVVRGSNDGIWDWNIKTGYDYLSPRWKEILGYRDDELPNELASFFDRIHPDDVKHTGEALAEHFEGQAPYKVELRLRHKDGSYRWILSRGEAVRDDDGAPVRMVGSIIDITERKQMELALRSLSYEMSTLAGQAFFHAIVKKLFEFIGEGMVFIGELSEETIDKVHTVAVYADGAIQSNFDYLLKGTPCKLVIGHDLCLFTQDVAKLFPDDRMLADIRAEGYAAIPLWGAQREALGILCVITQSPIATPRQIRQLLQIFATPVAAEVERQRCQTTLRESESRLREAQALVRLGSWELNLVSMRLVWSDEVFRIFEINPMEFQPTYEGFLDLVHPDDRILVDQAFHESLRDKTSYDLIHRLLMPDGRIKFVHERGLTHYEEDGLPRRSMGTVQDITDRVHSQERIKALEIQRVQSEKLVALGQLAAGIAHEINNPLAGIKNAFLLLKPSILHNDPLFSFVGLIDREINRMSAIVRQMYQLYKPQPSSAVPVDLEVVFRDLWLAMSNQIESKLLNLCLDIRPDSDRFSLKLHQDQLFQVLRNLLQNAIDASPPHGIITVTVLRNLTTISILVTDQGIGIHPEHLPRIFEPFFSTKVDQPSQSLGLGLSVAHSLITSMSGTIRATSTPGGGTTFSVVLPLSELGDSQKGGFS